MSVAQEFQPVRQGNPLAYLVGIPCVIYSMLSLPLRQFGEMPLLLAIASAATAIILSGKLTMPRRYAPFLTYSFSILTLSLMGVMPAAWTEFRDSAAAVRQWFYVPVLAILVLYFSGLFSAYWTQIRTYAGTWFVLLFLVSRAGQSLHHGDPLGTGQTGTFDPLTDIFIYTFTNDAAFVTLAALILLFRTTRHVLIDLGFIFAMLLLASSSQSQVLWIAVAAVRVLSIPRTFSACTMVSLFAFILISPLFISVLEIVDHNSAVRAILWRDSQEAVIQTYGIGVGYGTEYIKNRFEEIMPWGWYIGSSPNDMFVATHSAFYDILLREGVIGLALFLWWFLPGLRVPMSYSLADTRLACSVGLLLVINNTVNVGMSSIGFLFGSAATVAVLAAMRQHSGDEAEQKRPATSSATGPVSK